MNKKSKAKVGIASILLTSLVGYLVQHWFIHSGLEDKIWNKYVDLKEFINKETKGGK